MKEMEGRGLRKIQKPQYKYLINLQFNQSHTSDR